MFRLLGVASCHLWAVAILSLIMVSQIGCAPQRSHCVEVPHDEQCERRLKRIWEGLKQHREVYGVWPANRTGPTGYEHSWRVVIFPLPLSDDPLRPQFDYRFDQPWNSLHNHLAFAPFSGDIAFTFQCPSEQLPSGERVTSYLMIVRASHDGEPFPELPSDAVLVVESAECGIGLSEPVDIDMDSLWKDSSPYGVGRLHSLHADVIKALRVDGAIIDIPKGLSNDELKRLLEGTPFQ